MSEHSNNNEASAAQLLTDVATGVARLVKGELLLARVEAANAAKVASGGVIKLVVAVMFGLAGINVLAGAAVAWLASTGMGPAVAGLIVAAALLGICLVLVLSARSAFQLKNLVPRKALRGLASDADALRAGLTGKGTQDV